MDVWVWTGADSRAGGARSGKVADSVILRVEFDTRASNRICNVKRTIGERALVLVTVLVTVLFLVHAALPLQFAYPHELSRRMPHI